jgi:hypothetical protein
VFLVYLALIICSKLAGAIKADTARIAEEVGELQLSDDGRA